MHLIFASRVKIEGEKITAMNTRYVSIQKFGAYYGRKWWAEE